MEANTQLSKLVIIDEKDVWNARVSKSEEYDIYYTYEYCQWTAKAEGGQAKLICFKNEWGSVIYPIIIRKIENGSGRHCFDITTPYGYGGPIISGDKQVLDEFTSLLRTYCLEKNIVAEVIRLHPLLRNASYLSGYCNLKYIRKTTAVNLSGNINDIQENYSNMTKRNIKKALNHKLECRAVDKTDENIEVFLKLYESTMNRKNASDYYYFDFTSIKDQLIDTAISKSYLLFVYHGEKVISAVILLTANSFAHYHLGASDKRYLELRPNNLIFDFMVQFSKNLGCKLLHLGGGYQENDNLFKYKSSFTNHNNYDFVLGTNIFNLEIYNELVKMASSNSSLKEGFFPLYRSPSTVS